MAKAIKKEKASRMKKINIISLLIIILSGLTLHAQQDYSISLQQEYHTNPFRLPDDNPEFINSVDLGISNTLGDFNLLYYGSYSMFSKSIDRNYYWHQLGFYKENDNSISGIYAENRINKTEYDVYNYYDLTAYYRHRFMSEIVIPSINFSATYRKYSNLSQYDNLYINGGISLNKSLQSKTTFILSSTLNYKNYINSSTQTYLASGDSMGNTTLMGNGHGRRFGSTASSMNVITSENVINTQLNTNLRIAQSLFESTGAAVYYFNRIMLGSQNNFNNDIEYNSGDESDLYDDPISRNENTIGIDITQLLPLGFTAKTGYEYSLRKYPNQGTYISDVDYDAGIQRDDKRGTFYFNLSKGFPLTADDSVTLKTSFYFELMNNTSNSYWYNYENNSLALYFTIEF